MYLTSKGRIREENTTTGNLQGLMEGNNSASPSPHASAEVITLEMQEHYFVNII